MLYIINWLLFVITNACGHFVNRWAAAAALVIAYGWYTNTVWAVLAGIAIMAMMGITGVVNAVLTFVSMALHIRAVSEAEEDMGRAKRVGDNLAYEYARKDKLLAINSLVGHMGELATWTQVGFEFNVAVTSLREQVRDGGHTTVRW